MHDPRKALAQRPTYAPLPVPLRIIKRVQHWIDVDTAIATARADANLRVIVGPTRAFYVRRDTLARLATIYPAR